MKKPLKYGLIAGGLLIATVFAFVFLGYKRGRSPGLPSLPTPPGATVPPGMRYVGGDEFDGPDGSAPDATRWQLGVSGRNIATATIEHGSLILRGREKDSLQILSLKQKFHRGRIEVRVRFPQPGRTTVEALSLVQSTSPYTVFEIVSMMYSDKFGPSEGMARRSRNIPSVPTEFITYVMDWDADKMAVSRNGAPAVSMYYTNEASISELTQKHWKQPWKIIGGWKDNRAGTSDLMKQLESDLSFSIFHKGARDMELDYLRIFQE